MSNFSEKLNDYKTYWQSQVNKCQERYDAAKKNTRQKRIAKEELAYAKSRLGLIESSTIYLREDK